MNMMTTGTTNIWTIQAKCPKCGKPYYYVGDPVGDISQLVCTCNQSELRWNGWYPTTSESTAISMPDPTQLRIADALERIATALEAMAPAPKYHCAACGKETEFYVSGPYGSKHEDEIICADCFDRAFGA